jgi:hypothetical protein
MLNNARRLALLSLIAASSFAGAQSTVDERAEEARRLTAKAQEVTRKISELTASGRIAESDEGLALLRQAVEELAQIRERQRAIEEELAAFRTGQQRTATAVEAAGKTRFSGYMQFQFRDTNLPGGLPDAFHMRRVRLSVTHQADPRTQFRITSEFAGGSNQLQSQVRDAFIQYTGEGWTGQAGQFRPPFSFQANQSSADREFPERTLYNQGLMAGERFRGIVGRTTLGEGVSAFAGVANALAIQDPEGVNLSPGAGSRLAGVGGVRYTRPGFETGVGALAGTRPAYTAGSPAATAPATDRRVVFADAALTSGPWVVRGEVMSARDRVPRATPVAGAGATDQTGAYLHLGYRLSAMDSLHARYETWDRDTSTPGTEVHGFGLSYVRTLTPAMRLQAAYESFNDPAATLRRYHVTTLRLQYRF